MFLEEHFLEFWAKVEELGKSAGREEIDLSPAVA